MKTKTNINVKYILMKKKDVMYKYYKYPSTNRVTKQTDGSNRITGCGMIVRLPMLPNEMDLIINKYLTKIQ